MDSNIAFLDVEVLEVPSFEGTVIEIKSNLSSQTERVTVNSGVKSLSHAQSNECPGPSCPDADSLQFGNILIGLFTIIVVVLLILICRPARISYPTPSGVSPYAGESPYPDRTASDSAFVTPFNRSDVSPSRRRHSPVFGRRNTPGSSPRGLFSVTQ